jgi:hypothetical protein
MNRVLARSDHILGVMLKGQMVTDEQYQAALVQIPLSGQVFPYGDPQTFNGTDHSASPWDKDSDASALVTDEGQEKDKPPEDESYNLEEGIVEIPIGTPGENPRM